MSDGLKTTTLLFPFPIFSSSNSSVVQSDYHRVQNSVVYVYMMRDVHMSLDQSKVRFYSDTIA